MKNQDESNPSKKVGYINIESVGFVHKMQSLAQGVPRIHKARNCQEAVKVGLELACELASAPIAALQLRENIDDCPARSSVSISQDFPARALDPKICLQFFSMFEKSLEPILLSAQQLMRLQPDWTGDFTCLLFPMVGRQAEIMGLLQFFGVESLPFGARVQTLLQHFSSVFSMALESRISDRREDYCRKELEVQVDKYRSFIERSSEGVWRFETDQPLPINRSVAEQVKAFYDHGFLAEGNDAMAKMYGYKSANQIIGLRLNKFLVREDPANVALLEDFVKSGYQLVNAESVGRDLQGNLRYFLNNFVGVIENGYMVRAWGTKLDITEHKKLETQLTLAAQEAEEANRAKSFFLANMSHEIRTPLGVMMGFADLALDCNTLPDETKKYITTIKRNGQQLSNILGEVLDISKIEASRFEVESLRFPLLPVVEEVISFMELGATEKGIRLVFRPMGPLPKVVRTDPTRLRQVLVNLIGNAIKFTPKGEVRVELRTSVPLKPGTPLNLEFSVIDTGIGIAEDRLPRLFQPYSQMESSTSRNYGGTGLGLMLSKQLCAALGGELILKCSALGVGSTFSFSIDGGLVEGEVLTFDAPPEMKLAKSSASDTEFHGKQVLLVEDQPDNQILLRRYLGSMGFDVSLAADGVEALEKAKQGNFDLILMDIQMPRLDGHQATRELRISGYDKPILAITAHAFKEDRERAFASGFNEYLTKPIQRSTLFKAIARRLVLH